MTTTVPVIPARRRRFAWIADAFIIDGRFAWPIALLFVLINALVLLNAVVHNPKIGYDASQHLKYATTLAKGQLPTPVDTHEFFSPPLPYLPTALLWATLDAGGRDGRAEIVLKLAQAFQVCCSVVFTLALVKIARLVRGGGVFLPAAALGFIGLLPTYYRTFAMIRGEPLLATLALLATYLAIRTFAVRRPTMRAGALLGITLGLAVLSRQWAFFLLPALGAIGLWRLIADAGNRGATLRAGLVVLAMFALVGGPFYLHLQQTYGSVRAFNRDPQTEEDASPPHETLPAAEALRAMVTHPVRDVFAGHPILLFYADVWGDYWQYYLVYATDRPGHYVRAGAVARTAEVRGKGNNYRTMSSYLGRVCAAGSVPTALAVAGFIGGIVALRRVNLDGRSVVLPTLSLSIVTTIAGYAWFVMSYPNDAGDTIKASYPLQLYGPLAILAGAVLTQVYARSPRVAWVFVGVLMVVTIHNLPACVSRYR
jgi:hypothetical protein